MSANEEQIEYENTQFITDDLMTMVDLRLLRLEHNGNGDRIFAFTRADAQLVAGMKPRE